MIRDPVALKVKLSLKSMLCSAFLQISLLPVYSYIYIAVMAHVDVDQLQFDAILQFIYYARIAVCDTIIWIKLYQIVLFDYQPC